MTIFRVVRIDKVYNPSGLIGIRRRLVCNRNTLVEAQFIADELTRQLGGNYEVQERSVSSWEAPLRKGGIK